MMGCQPQDSSCQFDPRYSLAADNKGQGTVISSYYPHQSVHAAQLLEPSQQRQYLASSPTYYITPTPSFQHYSHCDTCMHHQQPGTVTSQHQHQQVGTVTSQHLHQQVGTVTSQHQQVGTVTSQHQHQQVGIVTSQHQHQQVGTVTSQHHHQQVGTVTSQHQHLETVTYQQVGTVTSQHQHQQVGTVTSQHHHQQVGTVTSQHPHQQVGTVTSQHPHQQVGTVTSQHPHQQVGTVTSQHPHQQVGTVTSQHPHQQVGTVTSQHQQAGAVVSHHQHHSTSTSLTHACHWLPQSSIGHHRESDFISQHHQFAHTSSTQSLHSAQSSITAESQYPTSTQPSKQNTLLGPIPPQQFQLSADKHFGESAVISSQQQLRLLPSEARALHSPLEDCGQLRSGESSEVPVNVQQAVPDVTVAVEVSVNSSPVHQPYYQHSPTMLDKKPTLQVLTSDHSPVSPASGTSSPRFIFPDMMQASSSSGHQGSDSGSSPFMSPVKREVKWEVGTPPQCSDLDPTGHQGPPERLRMLSGDTDPSETLVDSETGSSVLEDSSSSREQSPFSAMAESLSLRSPSEHSPSPLSRKVFLRQVTTEVSEYEDHGEELESSSCPVAGQPDSEFHPSKFKKRLHERYVLSLKDSAQLSHKLKEEVAERHGGVDVESPLDAKRPVSKIERADSPDHSESPMPKSPRRSSSDLDIIHTESTEMGASSADEGDVFMEPSLVGRAKHKPPSLHQREPLDLSRGTLYSGFRSSSGSSPLIDSEHISPASKIFSPVFRSPRLPYSPHGLLSPQSQSPLCSVPEGGRIFNFNMSSCLEGAHSDSDLISPSPMSPRVFTFPPQGSILNPMSEVNRLAVSPRAPYTPPPCMMHKGFSSGSEPLDSKWGEQHGFCGKRSLSESDMTYLCPVCGQVFPTNDNLAKHMAKHLPTETVRVGESNKVHYCKVCNRSFSRSDMLTRHMRLHTGLKPYECMECGQVFSRSDHLNTHRRTHTGEKPYRCPHCPYAACRRDMITRHMRTHAKRTSRRARYLSVPDDGDTHKPSGSISSSETTDSTGQTCSVSSVDSVESESILTSRPHYTCTSVDSLLSPDPDFLSAGQSSSSSRKASDDLEEGMEENLGQGGDSHYDRFLRYRKARNWSTTSLESVDSEEALLIREVLVDDAFPDSSHRPSTSGQDKASTTANPSKVAVVLETKTLQKCFISPNLPGSKSSGSS